MEQHANDDEDANGDDDYDDDKTELSDKSKEVENTKQGSCSGTTGPKRKSKSMEMVEHGRFDRPDSKFGRLREPIQMADHSI